MTLALWMMLVLHMQIPGGLHGQGPPAAPATRLACPPGECATVSSLPVAWGKVWSCWVLMIAGSHPLLLCWLETSPYSSAPGGGVPVAGDTLIHLLLPLPSTSWNCHMVHSQFASSARAPGRPHPPWHLSLGTLHLTGVPSPLQMLPAAFVK